MVERNDVERSESRRCRHAELSDKVRVIEELFAGENLPIHHSHILAGFLSDTKDLAAEWAKGNIQNNDINKLFSALHVERIHSVIELLKFENKRKHLKDLLNGTLNFFEREISHAKSIHWELEVFSKIKKVIPSAFLEEPDVVVNVDGYSLAIPCKKIFSEKGVPKVQGFKGDK